MDYTQVYICRLKCFPVLMCNVFCNLLKFTKIIFHAFITTLTFILLCLHASRTQIKQVCEPSRCLHTEQITGQVRGTQISNIALADAACSFHLPSSVVAQRVLPDACHCSSLKSRSCYYLLTFGAFFKLFILYCNIAN